MARYYFHSYNDVRAIDEEGADHGDLAEVRAYATASVRDMMSDDVKRGVLNLGSRIEVEDEHGTVVLVLYYRDAIELLNA